MLTSCSKGEKVTAKAHGGAIDITGITIATVDDKVRLQVVDTYFDPLDMFRQIAPGGIVNKQVINKSVDRSTDMDQPSNDGVKIAQEHNTPGTEHSKDEAPPASGEPAKSEPSKIDEQARPVEGAQQIVDVAAAQGEDIKTEATPANASAASETSSSDEWEKVALTDVPRSQYSSSVTGNVEQVLAAGQSGEHNTDYSEQAGDRDDVDAHLEKSAEAVHPHPKDMEEIVKPKAGEAVVTSADAEETRKTHEEMSKISPMECAFLMNRE